MAVYINTMTFVHLHVQLFQLTFHHTHFFNKIENENKRFLIFNKFFSWYYIQPERHKNKLITPIENKISYFLKSSTLYLHLPDQIFSFLKTMYV